MVGRSSNPPKTSLSLSPFRPLLILPFHPRLPLLPPPKPSSLLRHPLFLVGLHSVKVELRRRGREKGDREREREAFGGKK
jgi:hypothetical protein